MNASPVSVPDLRIDIHTQNFGYDVDLTSPSLAGQQTAPTRGFGDSPEPDRTIPAAQKAHNRLLNESRKLLAHHLVRLQNRPMPPSVFDAFKVNSDRSADKGWGVISETVKEAVKPKGGKLESRSQTINLDDRDEDFEGDEEKDNLFTTDNTFELLDHLREVCSLPEFVKL
jgi:hypothetical protein